MLIHFKPTFPLHIIRFLILLGVRKLKWVDGRYIFIPEMTKDFYQCRIQEWGYWYRSIVSKALDSFKFKSLNVHSLAFSVRSPASRVQELEPSVQSPASRVQCPESSVQSPESSVQSPASGVQGPASRVQRPTLASRVQELRYALKIHHGTQFLQYRFGWVANQHEQWR